jgi:hypothetical protein
MAAFGTQPQANAPVCPLPVEADLNPSRMASRFGTTRTRANSAACPLLAEADLRRVGGYTGFDPLRTSAGSKSRSAASPNVVLANPVSLPLHGLE